MGMTKGATHVYFKYVNVLLLLPFSLINTTIILLKSFNSRSSKLFQNIPNGNSTGQEMFLLPDDSELWWRQSRVLIYAILYYIYIKNKKEAISYLPKWTTAYPEPSEWPQIYRGASGLWDLIHFHADKPSWISPVW